MFTYYPASYTAAAWEARMFKAQFQRWDEIVTEYKARKMWMMRGNITYALTSGKVDTVRFGHTREMETMLKELPKDAYVRRIDLFGGFGFFAQPWKPSDV